MKQIILLLFAVISIQSFAQLENMVITNIITLNGNDHSGFDTVLTVPDDKIWVVNYISNFNGTNTGFKKIYVVDMNLYPEGHPNHQYTIQSYAYRGFNDGNNFDKVTFLIAGTNFWLDGGVYWQIWEYDAPSSLTGTLASSEVDIPLNEEIKLFPNPTDSKLALNSNKDYELEVYDLSGRKLMQTTGNTLDMSVLSNATYIVKAFDKDTKETNSYKVVKK